MPRDANWSEWTLASVCRLIVRLVQQLRHQTVADPVTIPGQEYRNLHRQHIRSVAAKNSDWCQSAHALVSPTQRRLRATTAQRLNQARAGNISDQKLLLCDD